MIVRDDVTHPAVIAFLEEHLADMRAVSPPESVHALDVEALRGPEMRFWSAWVSDQLVGTVALKQLTDGDVEIKSMRTAGIVRGSGVGRRLLAFVLEQARASGGRRVLLETGAEPYFEPARTMYRRAGFEVCAPFGAYVEDPNSVFMALSLI